MWKALQSGYGQATRGQAERLADVLAHNKVKVGISIQNATPVALNMSPATSKLSIEHLIPFFT